MYLRPLPRHEVCPAASVPLLRLTDCADRVRPELRYSAVTSGASHVVAVLPRLDRHVTFDLKLGRRGSLSLFTPRARQRIHAAPKWATRQAGARTHRLPCYASKFIPNWQRAHMHTINLSRLDYLFGEKKCPWNAARAGLLETFLVVVVSLGSGMLLGNVQTMFLLVARFFQDSES